MRAAVKYILGRTYQPFLVRYLSKTRRYVYKDIELEVPPEVFHPGFFFSTRFLLWYISKWNIRQKKVLELGAGSGLISIYAAKKGASVTASDINPSAIECLVKNTAFNRVDVDIVQSDLFDHLTRRFDIILINPPYYKKDAASYKEAAWYCGEQGGYFQKLFSQLGNHIHSSSKVVMVLCDGCDIDMIREQAAKNYFHMQCVETKQAFLEKHYLYTIDQMITICQ